MAQASIGSSAASLRRNSPVSRPGASPGFDRIARSAQATPTMTIKMPTPSRRQALQNTIDFGLGADVDAARRFVEDQHMRLGCHAPGQNDLLLVAPTQRSHGLRQAELREHPACPHILGEHVHGCPAQHAHGADLFKLAAATFSRTFMINRAPDSPPIGRDEGQTLRIAWAGECSMTGCPGLRLPPV